MANPEVYLEPSPTSKMELFAKKTLTAESSILVAWLGSTYASTV